MKTKLIVFIYFLLLLPACAYSIRYDGPYKGRIIDAETKQPIEGVVILGVWYKETPTVAGAVSSYYDAMETVTDKDGEFEILGLGLKILSNVAPMNVLIFRAGYEHLGLWPWESFKGDEILKEKVLLWDGDKATISLRKLTMGERRKRGAPPLPPGQAPKKKIILMLNEYNKEVVELGGEPITNWRE